MKSLIKLEDVSFSYGRENILEKINMEVFQGEYVVIIGANGAGKSTLLKLILGQLEPSEGKAYLMGEAASSFKNFGKIGYVPQVGNSKTASFPANVNEIVMTSLYKKIGPIRFPKKEHQQMVDNALRAVNMLEYKKRLIGRLSGGQQQRVMIARALVNEPELLILDEPITGIDRESEEALYSILEKLNKENNMAIVMITHNVEKVTKYTNKFYHLKDHKIHMDHSSVLCNEDWKTKRLEKNLKYRRDKIKEFSTKK